MDSHRLVSLLALFLVLLLSTCKKDGIEYNLVVSPQEITFTDNDTVSVFLSVSPVKTARWSIRSKPSLIRTIPEKGTIKNGIAEIKISVDNNHNLTDQITNMDIIFEARGSNEAKLNMKVHILNRPKILITPDNLVFQENITSTKISIKNDGVGRMLWDIDADVPWLSFSKSNGYLATGIETGIVVTVDRQGLPIGNENGVIVVNSNATNGVQEIPVSLVVPPLPNLSANNSQLAFCFLDEKKSFLVTNTGNTPVFWNLNVPNNFLIPNPSSGNIAVGGSQIIQLTLDRESINSSLISTTANVNYGNNQQLTIPIDVYHYDNNNWLVKGYIGDAEYDRANDVVIAVSTLPNRLRKFDPSSKIETYVSLSMPPTCVSVSLDGKMAVVGHHGKISYVNLETMSVQQVFDISTNAHDIVLAPNGWAYVFPAEDQWERVRCVDLSTGVELLHEGSFIYSGMVAKMHPSGNYIYGVDTKITPSFKKFDISDGRAKYLYKRSLHSSSWDHRLWMSDDGNRILCKNRDVSKASDDPDEDMSYLGTLSGQFKAVAIDHNSQSGFICAIYQRNLHGVPNKEVKIFNSQSLTLIQTHLLPYFYFPDNVGGCRPVDSQGHYVFFNSAGNKIYVLTYAGEGTGSLDNWAIVTISL